MEMSIFVEYARVVVLYFVLITVLQTVSSMCRILPYAEQRNYFIMMSASATLFAWLMGWLV